MTDHALAWRVEQACFNAWPAIRQLHFGDWAARQGGGLTRRINSANPLAPRAEGLDEHLPAIEDAYRRWGLRPRVRVPAFLPRSVDAHLEAAGYELEAETATLFAPIDQVRRVADPAAEVSPAASAAWLEARARLGEQDAAQQAAFGEVIGRLSLPCGFAVLKDEDAVAAVAFGAIHDRLLCVEAVVTDARRRGRGLGTRMLAALFHWADSQDCEAVCLQVQGDNGAGLALYRSLGLSRELYRYHYRSAPDG